MFSVNSKDTTAAYEDELMILLSFLINNYEQIFLPIFVNFFKLR